MGQQGEKAASNDLGLAGRTSPDLLVAKPDRTLRPSVASPSSQKLYSLLSEQVMPRRVALGRQPEPDSSNQISSQGKDHAPDKSSVSASIRDLEVHKVDTSTAGGIVRTQTAKINIDTLGQISIKPHFVDGHARLEMGVQSEAASEWLQNRLKALGLDLNDMRISVHENSGKEHPEAAKSLAESKLAPLQALDRSQEIYQAARRSAVQVLDKTQNELNLANQERMANPAKLNKLNGDGEIPNKSAQQSILPHQNQTSRVTSDNVSNVWRGVINKSGSTVKRHGHSNLKSDSKSVTSASSPKQGSGIHAVKQEQLDQKSGRRQLDGPVKSVSNSDLNSSGDSNSTTFGGPALTSANTSHSIINGKLMGGQIVDRSQLPEMIQKIVDIANSQSSLTSRKLEVQMKVEKLGDLLVDAVKHQDKIHLHIGVESNEVRRLIEAQIRPLIDQMVKEGIEIGKLEVSLKHSKDQGQNPNLARHNTNDFSDRRQQQASNDWEFQEEQNSPRTMARDFGYNSLEVWA
jgi:hypothetical protein